MGAVWPCRILWMRLDLRLFRLSSRGLLFTVGSRVTQTEYRKFPLAARF
jgi:hypothetical protein